MPCATTTPWALYQKVVIFATGPHCGSFTPPGILLPPETKIIADGSFYLRCFVPGKNNVLGVVSDLGHPLNDMAGSPSGAEKLSCIELVLYCRGEYRPDRYLANLLRWLRFALFCSLALAPSGTHYYGGDS